MIFNKFKNELVNCKNEGVTYLFKVREFKGNMYFDHIIVFQFCFIG